MVRGFRNAQLIFPDKIALGSLEIAGDRISRIHENDNSDLSLIDLSGAYLAPGFIDIHVHGGAGADFMDGTTEAFQTACRCHLQHGTTSVTPTSTVAEHHEYFEFLNRCQELTGLLGDGSRILGGHLYGPYFLPEAKGCHPNRSFLTPDPEQDEKLLAYAGNGLRTLTIAPELPGSERLARRAKELGLLVTAGHSYATFQQIEESISWGVSHIDHLFCAMSDRARLRLKQSFPMRAGVMEATLFFDELTTEVIADGQHLSAELLRLAHKIKGPDRLALVSDSMRAVDCPDGEYWFGPAETGERIRRLGQVGVTLDGQALASGVLALDDAVRNFHRLTGVPLQEVIRMATLTPARILGVEQEFGSLAEGKIADLVVLDDELRVKQVYLAGERTI
jgi:N-acetylglucosamine-6-phosphate deacetylase